MENNEPKACKASLESIKQAALEHYEELAIKCHHWNSFIPQAIKSYQETSSTEGEEKRLKDIENAYYSGFNQAHYSHLHPDICPPKECEADGQEYMAKHFPVYSSSPSTDPSNKEEEKPDHVHVRLSSGAVANVSPDASPELLEALDKMAELAKDMPDLESTPISRIEKEQGEVSEGIMEWIRSTSEEIWRHENAILEPGELADKVAIAMYHKIKHELERQISLKKSCLSTIDDQIKTRKKLESENAALQKVVSQVIAQNESLCEERDRYRVSWEEREKVMLELEKERDEYRQALEEVHKGGHLLRYRDKNGEWVSFKQLLAKYPSK